MIDPIVTLAFSVQSMKGVYALLLGSGVSRSAGIPTGWEIVTDLANKLASVQDGDISDPIAWYQKTYGKDPEYSILLDQLTSTQSERSQLLRRYFEPTEEERIDGQKTPTNAHHAIADLVARGYIRIILTTNFDHLLEEAIRSAGVRPTVISTPDAIKGAAPLQHSVCTVIKLHGDYLDNRIKNTPSELEKYDPDVDALLDRVLDEYGLIVCGWSADWDTALRAAIERCKNRRYPVYWSYRTALSDHANRLVQQRDARLIPAIDAEDLFFELNEKIISLETFDQPHPVSVDVAVATVKRYLPNESDRIKLHDYVMKETSQTVRAIKDLNFSVTELWDSQEELQTILERRLEGYEAGTRILRSMVQTSAYYGLGADRSIWKDASQRLVNEIFEYQAGQDL